jgi:uncharacterized protein YjlB
VEQHTYYAYEGVPADAIDWSCSNENVGAYPPGQHADIWREAPTQAQLASIKQLPFPDRGLVKGGHETYLSLRLSHPTKHA